MASSAESPSAGRRGAGGDRPRVSQHSTRTGTASVCHNCRDTPRNAGARGRRAVGDVESNGSRTWAGAQELPRTKSSAAPRSPASLRAAPSGVRQSRAAMPRCGAAPHVAGAQPARNLGCWNRYSRHPVAGSRSTARRTKLIGLSAGARGSPRPDPRPATGGTVRPHAPARPSA